MQGWFYVCTSQWGTTLQCNVVFHWLGAYLKLSLQMNATIRFLRPEDLEALFTKRLYILPTNWRNLKAARFCGGTCPISGRLEHPKPISGHFETSQGFVVRVFFAKWIKDLYDESISEEVFMNKWFYSIVLEQIPTDLQFNLGLLHVSQHPILWLIKDYLPLTCGDQINPVQHSKYHGCCCPGSLHCHDTSSCLTWRRISTYYLCHVNVEEWHKI